MVLVSAETTIVEGEDVAMNFAWIDLVCRSNSRSATIWTLKICTEENGIVRNAEMTMDQMDTKEVLCLVLHKDRCECLNMLVLNWKLLTIIEKRVVAVVVGAISLS